MRRNTYKVLVISPYEGFAGIVRKVFNEHNEFSVFDLDIEMLALNQISYFLKNAPLSSYDIVISRGQSAIEAESYLRRRIPLVNIGFSPYDVLRSLKLAMNSSCDKIAFLTFPDMGNNVATLFELMSGSENVRLIVENGFHSEEEMEKCIIRLHEEENVNLFIGDGVCNRLAKRHELDNILITSGEESVYSAMKTALRICCGLDREEDGDLVEKIIKKSLVPLSIYNKQGELVFSNLYSISSEYTGLDLLPYLERSMSHRECRFIASVGRQTFRVHSSHVELAGSEYVVFFITNSFTRTPKNRELYDVITLGDAQDSLVYIVNSPTLSSALEKANSSPQSKLSVFVYGERSCGKSTFIKAVYASSQFSRSPMLVIDCLQLNEEQLIKLFEDDRSALLEKDCVVYFKNMHVLSGVLQNKLEYYLKISCLSARHKLLTSYTGDVEASLRRGTFSESLYRYLAGTSIYIPGISERNLDIPNIVRICLNQLNQRMPIQIASIDQGAMQQLQRFPWPNGIDQIKSVIEELALSSDSQVIREENVSRLLTNLSSHQDQKLMASQEVSQLDLRKPLEEIIQDIIQIVFREENMNQTKTAQRLGISRTSLWKKLNQSTRTP